MGTLWKGMAQGLSRTKNEYLRVCMHYIELNLLAGGDGKAQFRQEFAKTNGRRCC
jgi:hypothetical protein